MFQFDSNEKDSEEKEINRNVFAYNGKKMNKKRCFRGRKNGKTDKSHGGGYL